MCVMMLDYFLNEEYIDKVLNILLSIDREEYYINMAIAWTLANAYVDFKDKINDIIINKSYLLGFIIKLFKKYASPLEFQMKIRHI